MNTTTQAQGTLRSVLTMLGVVITSLGVLYFAVELGHQMSDPGRVLSLVLLTTIYVSLGRHFEATFPEPGRRFFRVPVALYALGAVSYTHLTLPTNREV